MGGLGLVIDVVAEVSVGLMVLAADPKQRTGKLNTDCEKGIGDRQHLPQSKSTLKHSTIQT